MRYGFFDDDEREYVIERPDTPLPWINYIGTQDMLGIISNTAGGYTFYKDARLRRLTRYRYNNAPLDANGRYLYLRDDSADPDAGDPVFWSPNWQPTRTPLDKYECRHGMGYTTIQSEKAGIKAETRYFIPLDENLEIWQLTLTNMRETEAQISVFGAVEFNLWDAMDDATNFQRNFSIGEVEVMGGVIYHKTEYRERRDHFAYFACSQPQTGFDTQREAFLGAYRGWDDPQAVEKGRMGESVASGWQPIGALHTRIHLMPGETRSVVFLLGYQENPPEEKFDPPSSQKINKRLARRVIEQFLQPEKVESAFADLRSYWTNLFDTLQVQTPDPHTNRMVNIWNAYQTMVTFKLSRSASYFESGIGRGMGFRDSNQDLLGFVHFIPERARERLLDLAATQMENGGAYHQYQPLTKKGNDEIGSNFNDDPLWLVVAVAAYLKETGDWEILQTPVEYDNQPGTEAPLLDHLERAMQYTLDRLGPHQLPLIGRADWNDCLNLNSFSSQPGESFQTTTNFKEGHVAESVFIAGLFVLAAKEMAAIWANMGDAAMQEKYQFAWEQMSQAVWASGWDGDWFRRAYDHYGQPVGSQTCDEGQLFIEPQGICIMAGLGADNGKARRALDAVAERLATPHGIVLHQPAYSKYYLHLGEISSYPPGYKENAGIFCHSNPWIMIAETIIGRGERAYDYYMRINPSAREAISDLHRCEPYVYAQMIAGKDAPAFGEAKNSWLTGTAAWNYVAITQWILGIRPEMDGLRISPVIPQEWPGFSAKRKYRSVDYNIEVIRQGPGNAVRLVVDSKEVTGSLIPLPDASIKQVEVKAYLG